MITVASKIKYLNRSQGIKAYSCMIFYEMNKNSFFKIKPWPLFSHIYFFLPLCLPRGFCFRQSRVPYSNQYNKMKGFRQNKRRSQISSSYSIPSLRPASKAVQLQKLDWMTTEMMIDSCQAAAVSLGSARFRVRTIGTHQQLVLTANKHQVCVMFWSWSWWTFSCCLFIFFVFAARLSVLFRLIIFENVNG